MVSNREKFRSDKVFKRNYDEDSDTDTSLQSMLSILNIYMSQTAKYRSYLIE